MYNKLCTLHWNCVVLLDRVELNVLVSALDRNDERAKIAKNVLARTLNKERELSNPCMNVPIRVWELKKLFPNYETKPPIWWERQK